MIPESGNRFSEKVMVKQDDSAPSRSGWDGSGSRYDFRPVTEKDLPMIAAWLAEPHVAEWWGNAETEIAQVRDHIDSISVEPLIVELDGRPIGYLQSYDPHLEDGHPYSDQPFGTLGIDLSIGRPELVGRGHGRHCPAVRRTAFRGRGAARHHRPASV